jgi:hypothetical protein
LQQPIPPTQKKSVETPKKTKIPPRNLYMFAPKAKTIKIKILAQDNFKNLFVLAPPTKQILILVLLKKRKSNFAKLLARKESFLERCHKLFTSFSCDGAWNSFTLLQNSRNAKDLMNYYAYH